jgi:hypothetical protein
MINYFGQICLKCVSKSSDEEKNRLAMNKAIENQQKNDASHSCVKIYRAQSFVSLIVEQNVE